MKQFNLDDNGNLINANTTPYDMSNAFNVLPDEARANVNTLTFNFNKSITISIPKNSTYCQFHEATPKDNWMTLSAKYYNTYKLWWVIAKANGISNPHAPLSGVVVIPNFDVATDIAEKIREL